MPVTNYTGLPPLCRIPSGVSVASITSRRTTYKEKHRTSRQSVLKPRKSLKDTTVQAEQVLRFVYSMALERALGRLGVVYFQNRPPTQDPIRRRASLELEPELPMLPCIFADISKNPIRVRRPTRQILREEQRRILQHDFMVMKNKLPSLQAHAEMKNKLPVLQADMKIKLPALQKNTKHARRPSESEEEQSSSVSLDSNYVRRNSRAAVLKVPPIVVTKKRNQDLSTVI